MTPDELRKLSDLLDEGMGLAPDEREAWLGSLQGEALRLAPTLRELLGKHALRETGDLVDAPPPFTAPGDGSAPSAEFEAGATIGPYRLRRELGRGGMGEVWLAERVDGQLKREVALKLPILQSRRGVLVQRFARERDILGSLAHPNIARLYDAGVDEHGQPYLALEYVEGVPIDAHCRERSSSVEARLALLLQVADAVAFAHSRLVLHRDLKPSNILVTPAGQVRLLDFGVAKLMEGDSTEETELTRVGGRALTFEYASPEQLRGEPLGTPSDVYSLGVVAYELLTGQRPYRLPSGSKGASAVQWADAIARQEAPLASTAALDSALRPRLRGDLDAILNQALKKSPGERYASVDALANDWRHHLDGLRVSARPDSLWYRASRFGRRHRTPLSVGASGVAVLSVGIGLGATAVVIAALVAGVAVASWQARSAMRARDQALRTVERDEAVTGFLNLLLTDAARGGETFTAQQLLRRSEQLIEREYPRGGDVHAIVLSMMGTAMQTLGNLADAQRLHERAVAAARDSVDAGVRDTVRAHWAAAIGWTGRLDEARAALLDILAHRSATMDLRASVHHYLCDLASSNQDAAAALQHAEEALRCLRACKNPSHKMEASLLASLGAACSLNRRMADADRHFAAAMARVEAAGQDRSPQGITMLNNWAVISERSGDAPRAFALAERALAASAPGPRSPFIVTNRARALECMGRLDEAEAGYTEGLALARERGAPPAALSSQIGLVSIALQRQQLDAAAGLLAGLAKADTAPPGHPNRVSQLLVEGRLATALDERDAAWARLTEVIAAPPPMPTTVMALLARAELLLRQRRLDEALVDAQQALALATELQGGKPHSFRTGLAALMVAQVRQAQAVPMDVAVRQALSHLQATVDGAHPALARAREMAAGAA